MAEQKNKKIMPNVLVVDDDKNNLIAMRTILEDLPVKIIESDTGVKALSIASETSLALILLDVQMPDMDGFEVAKLLRQNKHTSEIPIIFVTAINKETKYVEQGHDIGAVDYLFKPINDSILKSKVMVFANYYIQNKEMSDLLSQLDAAKKSLEKSNADLNTLARIDVVTGLPNRLSFNEHLTITLASARREKKLLAVLYLDLDDFKQVNDTYGHEQGDVLLKEISDRIRNLLRINELHQLGPSSTLLFRLGGDEFSLILANIKRVSEAGIIAERIIKAVNHPVQLGKNEAHVGVSLGIACYPFAGEIEEKIQKCADIAMYRAKEQGKNNFQYYTDELNEEHDRYLLLEFGLREALDKKQLSLVYQPIHCLENNQVMGCEVLCRWNHPTLGLIEAEEFIHIAEDHGKINEIGEWMCQQGLIEFTQNINAQFPDLKIHLNLSAKQLVNASFVEFLKALQKKYNLPIDRIVFELTESSLTQDPEHLKNNINLLASLGYSISIDDFGVGYSSLSRLKMLPVSSIKLDKSFLVNVAEDKKTAFIANSMISLAHDLDIQSIAEGVETQQQLNFLRKTKCNAVQGYLLSKPMPISQFTQFVAAHS